jgi:hypothetical protein
VVISLRFSFLGQGHFQVELDVDRLLEEIQVPVLDVAAIFAKVQGDPIRPAQLGLDGGPNGVGFVSPAGLPHGGDMVDVDS